MHAGKVLYSSCTGKHGARYKTNFISLKAVLNFQTLMLTTLGKWVSPCKILTEISARISASFWPARLGEISSRSQNRGGQKLSENLNKISSKIFGRSQSLSGQNLAENLGKTSSKISSRYQNLGGQKNLAEKTGSFLGNVSKIF